MLSSLSIRPSQGARGEEILDGIGGRGRRERKLPFSLPSFPFSPETSDTQANVKSQFPPSRLHLCANLHREKEVWEQSRGSTVFKMQCFAFCD